MGRKNFLKSIDAILNVHSTNKDKEGIALVTKSLDFIKGCSWTSNKKAKRYLELRYLPDIQLSESLDVSLARVRGISKELSDDLYKVFGGTFLSDLLSKNREAVELKLSVLNAIERDVEGSPIVPNWVRNDISTVPSANDVNVNDCIREISFLKKYYIDVMRNDLAKLDLGRLKYIIKVLDSDSKTNTILEESRKERVLELFLESPGIFPLTDISDLENK